ncbi:MAG TPA: DMT family transporter [bacterium]|nr:DMT family transporter [bacterium]HPN33878.1 DMT family transporter [bacterium]
MIGLKKGWSARLLMLAVGLCSISVSSVLIKLCDAPALVIASYRLTLAALFYGFLAFSRTRRPYRGISDAQARWAVFSGLFLSLHFIAWISSLEFTSVASSVVLVQTAPVLVAIGSFLFFQEKGAPLLFAGIVLCLAGSLFISHHDYQAAQSSLLGNALAVLGAFGAAGYLLIGRKLRPVMSTILYVSLVYSAAAAATLMITGLFAYPLWGYPARTVGLFFLIALFPQIIGHTTLNWALKHFSATAVSIMTLAEPIGATILAYLILHESVGWIKIAGGVVILSGIALTLVSENRSD